MIQLHTHTAVHFTHQHRTLPQVTMCHLLPSPALTFALALLSAMLDPGILSTHTRPSSCPTIEHDSG